jgi:hypothetical protein
MAVQRSSRPDKRRDFWFGYAAWFVLNGTWFVINLMLPGGIAHLSVPGVEMIASGLIVLLNLAVPIALAFTRPLAALGTVTAMSTLLALVIVEVVLFALGDSVGAMASGVNVEGFGDIRVGFVFVEIGLIAFMFFTVLVLRAFHRRIR